MSFFTLLIGFASLFHLSLAGYTLQDNYTPSNWFSMFSFFTGPDPTNGCVDYVDQPTAQSKGLLETNANSVTWKVDDTTAFPINSNANRPSVRLASNNHYQHGLFILDVEHMPQGEATWPAWWTVGGNWPYDGEIDIIEGINNQATNQVTLHTAPGCTMASAQTSTDCQWYQGCGIVSSNTQSYGAGLNAIGGGVYAMEWTSSVISVYFFPRGSVPSDISSGEPNPSSWAGQMLASFSGPCNIDANFISHQIVFDTTLCGSWAGVQYSGDYGSGTGACNNFVAAEPGAFSDAYWTVNSLKVYQNNGVPAAELAAVPLPTTSAIAPPVPVSTQVAFSTTVAISSAATSSTTATPIPVFTQAPIHTTLIISAAAPTSRNAAQAATSVATASTTSTAPSASSTIVLLEASEFDPNETNSVAIASLTSAAPPARSTIVLLEASMFEPNETNSTNSTNNINSTNSANSTNSTNNNNSTNSTGIPLKFGQHARHHHGHRLAHVAKRLY